MRPNSFYLILVNLSFFRLTQQDKTYIILDKIYPFRESQSKMLIYESHHFDLISNYDVII